MKHYFLLRSVKRNCYVGILIKNFMKYFSKILLYAGSYPAIR